MLLKGVPLVIWDVPVEFPCRKKHSEKHGIFFLIGFNEHKADPHLLLSNFA